MKVAKYKRTNNVCEVAVFNKSDSVEKYII